MDLSIVSEDRKEVLRKIDEYERKGWFDKDVENDPPSPELRPEDVDYLGKKLSSKIKTAIANKMGRKFFEKMIKEGAVAIDGMEGGENLRLLKDTGAVITCNHFGIPDNYILYHCIQKSLKKKRLYKVIREGNYTGFSGLFGFVPQLQYAAAFFQPPHDGEFYVCCGYASEARRSGAHLPGTGHVVELQKASSV